ncbi:hypothetical protein Tco_1559820, partial [Tanacetum coccineum]
YVADSDPEEDPEEDSKDGPVNYPADGGDDDDDDSSDDDEDEKEASEEEEAEEEEEEEEHLAPANSIIVPVADHEEVERLLALPTPPPSPLISLSPPSAEERLARCLAAPVLPSSPLPRLSHLYGSLNHVRTPPGFRATMGRLRATSPLPPPVPTLLPLPSLLLPPSPLPPLPDSLFIPPVDRREDILEVELPPHKRLCLTTPASRYEVGESSTVVPRPTGGHKVDYRFIGTMEAEARRQRAETVGYGIKDTWVDPRETTEEVAPVTLEGVNTRVTELTAVQEQDTQDIYVMIEDTQDRQTQIHQTVEALVDDRQYHCETARLLDQEALGHLATAVGEIRALQAREQARADVPEGTGSSS